jgi:ribA/ribD-fused uncharacterized protein
VDGIYPFELFEKYLTPFSGHMLEYKGVLYTTLEHAYHCQRYTDEAILDEIKNARSAYLAWDVSQKYKSQQRQDWDKQKVEVMKELFRAKLAQHADVKNALLASGDALIIKHQTDPFWGDALDGTGRNEMGEIWMQLREELITI